MGPYYSKALDSLLVVPLPVLAWVLMLLEFVMLLHAPCKGSETSLPAGHAYLPYRLGAFRIVGLVDLELQLYIYIYIWFRCALLKLY